MPRKPKGQRADTRNEIASWLRTSTNFNEIEQALGAPLDRGQRNTIDFSLALAVQGRSKQGSGIPADKSRESLSGISETAVLLANRIVLSLKRGHARKLHRFLLLGRRKVDLREMTSDLLELALAADAEVRRQPPRAAAKGRPRTNDNWDVLVVDLAKVFEEVIGKKPTISFATGRPSGKFYGFVQATFAEIPIAIGPSKTALGPLIKRALKAREPT